MRPARSKPRSARRFRNPRAETYDRIHRTRQRTGLIRVCPIHDRNSAMRGGTLAVTRKGLKCTGTKSLTRAQ